jgi:hypothetical protein
MRPSIVEGHDGLRPIPVDGGIETRMHKVEALVPRNRLETAVPPLAHALQRLCQTFRAVHKLRVATSHLVADDPVRIGVCFRTVNCDQAIAGDGRG